MDIKLNVKMIKVPYKTHLSKYQVHTIRQKPVKGTTIWKTIGDIEDRYYSGNHGDKHYIYSFVEKVDSPKYK